jgi:D-alanine--poly(phosphoribitol) ligase subunit 2
MTMATPMETDTTVRDRTLAILSQVTGDRGLPADLDVPLYTSGLLDSLGTVALIAAFEEAFGLTISPADLGREAWSTPRALVADIGRRVARARTVR